MYYCTSERGNEDDLYSSAGYIKINVVTSKPYVKFIDKLQS